MRDFRTIFTKMLEAVPDSEKPFKAKLVRVIDSCAYYAPELVEPWDKMSKFLNDEIPYPPATDWEARVVSIFTDIPVSRFKQKG